MRAHAPHAILTFDRFHVMKLMNERLDDLRRELARETQTQRPRKPLRACGWLLLHRRDNLEKDAASRLERSSEINSTSPMRLSAQRGTGRLRQQDDGRRAWAFLREIGRKSHRQRNPSTSGHGQNPPPPGQRNPELLPHRSNQRKDRRNQSQDSRSARQRLWLSRRRFVGASTLFMKPSSLSSPKPLLFG